MLDFHGPRAQNQNLNDMADHDPTQSSPDGGTHVPDLIARYRVRRDAWIAQADELARLRDEVRGSAEREAMEIVTSARRNVRQVVMEARRELLVLSAQVQAALGEATAKADPVTLLHKAGIAPGGKFLDAGAPEVPDPGFAPEAAVNEILDEVQADMQALADDARALPLHVAALHEPAAPPQTAPVAPSFDPPPPVAPPRPVAPPPPVAAPLAAPEPSAVAAPVQEATRPVSSSAASPEPVVEAWASPLPDPVTSPRATFSSPAAADATWLRPEPSGLPEPSAFAEPVGFADPPTDVPSPSGDSFRGLGGLSGSASKALLSSPFSGDAVAVPQGRSVKTFVGLIVGIAAVVVLGTVFLLRDGGAGDAEPGATSAAAEGSVPLEGTVDRVAGGAGPVSEGTGPAGSPAAPTTNSRTVVQGSLSVVAEALREVWVRTTIDGEADNGRTLTAGDTITASAEGIISLRVGDAGALLVAVNDGEKRPLGPDGLVVTRQFVVEGYQPPDAAPDPVTAPPTPAAASAPPVATGPAPQAPAPQAQTELPASAPAAAPAAVPAAASGAPGATETITPATVVVATARQWLDAYHRQDNASMTALSTENLLLADERRPEERFPAGLPGVQRTLDRVSVQIAADTAVLTAVMTEQSGATTLVSPVSQVWVRGENGQWKVRQVRFVSEARLSQVFR